MPAAVDIKIATVKVGAAYRVVLTWTSSSSGFQQTIVSVF
jgi:hypothetical protein